MSTMSQALSIPPGPRPLVSWSLLFSLRKNPLRFVERLAHRYGDVAHFRIGPQRVYLLNHPDLVRELLVVHDEHCIKGRGLQIAKRLLGEGLLTSEGDLHKRQRALMQPVFHKQKVTAFAELMAEFARRTSQGWESGAKLEMGEEMSRLTLAIVARALFETSVDQQREAEEIGRALTDARYLFMQASIPGFLLLEKVIPPLRRRFERIKSRLDTTVQAIIAEHRANPELHQDLLSRLLETPMSDQQVRDEVMTLFLAGHETTAAAMSWTLHLLAQNPDWADRLAEELGSELGTDLPRAEQVQRLPLLSAVLAESLRLFPPAWVMGRRITRELEFGGYRFPRNSLLLASQWVVQRDERWYPDPLRFDPNRWKSELRAQRPRYAYFPFGGGSRVCVGEHFAWLEAALLLAVLARDWRFHPAGKVRPDPSITLRPVRLDLVLERR